MMYAAMLQGSASAADAAADGMHGLLPLERLDVDVPHLRSTLEAYYSMPIHVNVRFGCWQTIVAAPLIHDLELRPVTTAMLRYAKGIASAALGDQSAATEHRRNFQDVVSHIPSARRFLIMQQSMSLQLLEQC